MLDLLLRQPTRFLFFTGKGGVGKTSLSSATAVALADRGRRVLLVSTDPASNLSEVLATEMASQARAVTGVNDLFALDIDPVAAAGAYRERVVGPYRDLLPAGVVASIEEQLSGACTVEIAAFDEFTALLADPEATAGYDHVVFDTAPTGHTLRLLALPSAWTDFLDTSTAGVTCIGPLSGLTQAQDRYRIALEALADGNLTTLVLVTRPDLGAIAEADRAAAELAELGLTHQHLLVNGVFGVGEHSDSTANALADRHAEAVAAMPPALASLPRGTFPLLSDAPMGPGGLRALLHGTISPSAMAGDSAAAPSTSLIEIADRLADRGHGLVMAMGKGGVGKTTIAAGLAVELARRGLPVTLSTTDPAAHLHHTLGATDALPTGLTIARIDPEAEVKRYTSRVLSSAGEGLDSDALAVIEEDLRSPCTAEIAVFRAFADTVAAASTGIVILDTAPTGHTLLLLDAARGYQREVVRHGESPDDAVAHLLDRLRDPGFTTLLIVTLPEPTPVLEAAQLQHDLRRAGIEPTAWIANQSISATGTSDPVLAARAHAENRWLDEIRTQHDCMAIVPWHHQEPQGTHALEALVASSALEPI